MYYTLSIQNLSFIPCTLLCSSIVIDDSTSENQFESLDLNVAIPTELSEVELDANVTKRNHVPCMGSLSPPRPDKPKLTIQTEYL